MSERFDMIRERDGRWYVYNEAGTDELDGPFDSKEAAEARLREIEYFKAHRRDAAERRLKIANRLLMLKQMGRVEPRRRVPRQQRPFALEVEYGKKLVGYVDQVQAALAQHHALPRQDAAGDRIHAMIDEIRGRLLSREQMKVVVAAFGHRVAAHQRQQFARQVKAALGVDPELLGVDLQVTGAKLAGFVAENVSLIRSLTTTPLDEVERLITRSFASGERNVDLRDEIGQRFDVARSRASLIARDQVGKLNAQMARDANGSIGVDRWRWRSMRDEATREEHLALDEQSEAEPFSYSGDNGEVPPIMPGEEVQCRCYDEAVFEDIVTEVADLEAE